MTKSKKALTRQTTIFSRLNAGQIVNVKALAEEFGVGVRTIQKDMNERLSSTYDIVDKGHGNYAFAEGYRLRSAEDEEEKIAISLMKSLQQSAIPEMQEYIDTVIPTTKNYEEMFLFDLDFEPIEDIGTFKVILKAIQWKVGLQFVYTKTDGSTKEVTVHPYRIANFKNYWYLMAYDLQDEKIKSYYLKNISKLHNLYENFIANEAMQQELEATCAQIDSPWYGAGAFQVTLSLRGDAQFYLLRNLPKHMKVIDESEDHTLVRMDYNSDHDVLTLVKKWLPDIEIVDNTLLSKKLDKTLQTFLDRSK